MSGLITDINIVEILLLSVLSFIGAFFNRFYQFLKNDTPITLRTWAVIFLNMTVVTIICISIDSFLIDIHPRLMLLPPFLMSLVGDELFLKLMHVNSSIEFINWLLTTIRVKSGETNQTTSDDINNQIKQHESYQEIVKACVSITTKIEDGLIQYKKTDDINHILNCYREVAPEVSALEIRYRIEFNSDPSLREYIDKMMALEKKLEVIKNNFLFSQT